MICEVSFLGYTDQGYYHKTMRAKIYKEWLTDNIPKFKLAAERPIILVIDNAPYHITISNAIPQNSAKKQKFIDFLEHQRALVADGMIKNELITMTKEIYEQRPNDFNKKEVEEICHNFAINLPGNRGSPSPCIKNNFV